MLPEDVEQAVLAAKWGDAEADATEAIAKMLDAPRELVVRVHAAYAIAANLRMTLVEPADEEVPEDVQNAMAAHLRRALTRVRVRQAIRDGDVVWISVNKLIKNPAHVCRGCVHSVRCIAELLSTAEKCFAQGPPHVIEEHPVVGLRLVRPGKASVAAAPVKIRGDTVTVTCLHPVGTYTIDVGDIHSS
jgi:hypothetical protein